VSLKRSHGVKLPIRIANLAYWVTGTEGSNPSLSATQSVPFHYNLEVAADPRVTRGFCARCEPEKAISLRMVRIPRMFSPSAEETVRFTAGADFVHLSPL
jgi:hypothetical protein